MVVPTITTVIAQSLPKERNEKPARGQIVTEVDKPDVFPQDIIKKTLMWLQDVSMSDSTTKISKEIEFVPGDTIELLVPDSSLQGKERGKWANDKVVSGNRSLVRAPNGWIFVGNVSSNRFYIYCSKDKGETWSSFGSSIYVGGSSILWEGLIGCSSNRVFVVYDYNEDIYMKKYNYSGNLLDTYQLTSYSNTEHMPTLAVEDNNKIHIAWTLAGWGGDFDVRHKIVNESGQDVTSDVTVFGFNDNYCYLYPLIQWTGENLYCIARGCPKPSSSGDTLVRFRVKYSGVWSVEHNLGKSSWTPPRMGTYGSKVIVTWEEPGSTYRLYYRYSTNRGATSANWSNYFYWSNYGDGSPSVTSGRWHMCFWQKSPWKVLYKYTSSPDGSWSSSTVISDASYSNVGPFVGTYGWHNDSVAVTWWGDGTKYFDGSWRQPTVTYTLETDPNTNPPKVKIDGTWYNTPKSFDWTVSSSHQISAPDQPPYRFDHWSDGGVQTHNITVGSSNKTLTAYFTVIGVEEELSTVPKTFYLSQNYPDPFRSVTRIPYGVPKEAYVTLKVYDLTGREIQTLKDGTVIAGRHTVTWEGRDYRGQRVAPGVYFYRMEAGKYMETKKLTLLR